MTLPPIVTQILTTLIGFATVMLLLSILITFVIRAIHYLGDVRGTTLGEMVGALSIGYRHANGAQATAGDRPSTAFAVDVLTFPALHPGKKLLPQGPALTRPSKRQKLARSIDYIAKDDLLSIVCRLCGETYVAGQTPDAALPARWCGSLPPGAQKLAPLVAYIEEFFETVEGVTSDDFAASTKRLTRVLAGIVVVALNLNAFDLAQSLYVTKVSPDTAKENAQQALDMSAAALQVDPGPPLERDEYLNGQTANLSRIASLLDDPSYALGWQHSWLARAWCVADSECPPSAAVVPTSWPGWAWSVLVWFVGLVTSGILLSLGAPFWANRLQQLLLWQSTGAQNKDVAAGDDDAPPPPPPVPAQRSLPLAGDLAP